MDERVRDELGEQVQEAFNKFLAEFTSDTGDEVGVDRAAVYNYVEQIKEMKENERSTLYVDWNHVQNHHLDLSEAIRNEYYRFEPFLRKAVQNFVRSHFEDYVHDDDKGDREFWVSFFNMVSLDKMRDLTTEKVGTLIAMSGTVTRTSEVRPELMYGTFQCLECDSQAKDVEQQFKYSEPLMCKNGTCNNRKRWQLDVQASKFVDFQKVRVQENTTEIPAGSMPRSIDVILRNEAVEMAKAGDKCIFTGTLIVVPDVAQLAKPGQTTRSQRQASARAAGGIANEGVTGLKALGVRELTYKLMFLASSVQQADTRFGTANIRDDSEDVVDQFTAEERQELQQMRDLPNLYDRVVRSIAPTVFGHDDIKRGVLLMLFGGVHKETPNDHIKLRGDINVCIIGDPSTAKSQFLKYVVSFLPRAVYASGKASSAAGLTASVARDPETDEYCIEAGALMLADNGICCIDEFDKMDVKDQVAIHEAMEQQTISIAKAGIQATLNARTSILAAANPIGGRYDKSKPLRHNVAMTAPIMSRFDLFFVVVDEQEEITDYNIARHIVSLHQSRDNAIDPEFTTSMLQRYIKFARTIKPVLTPQAAELLVDSYKKLRQHDVSTASSAYRITVRQLESMVRLSEALARLHCDEEVKPKYVKEAARLLQRSIIHVEYQPVRFDDDDEEGGDGGDGGGDGGDGGEGGGGASTMDTGETGTAGEDGAQAPKQAPISFDLYRRIAHQIVHRLRRADTEEVGMKQKDLVAWYLEAHEGELSTMDEVMEMQRLLNAVIRRLTDRDHVLIELREEGEEETADVGERLLVAHPNYVME